jgi:hypothetical protein
LLLPLARISKSFVVNYVPNTPVGNEHVNSTGSIKRATRLSPETQVTLGATTGGIPPPKKMVPFFAKSPRALSMTRPEPRAKFKQGADDLAERACKPEIAYASTRIRPFSLATGPVGCLRKSNSPNSNLHKRRKKQNSAMKTTSTIHFHKCLKQNVAYLHVHMAHILTYKQKKGAWRPAIFRLEERRRQRRLETGTPRRPR